MTTTVGMVNFLVARSALMHRQFQALLEELYNPIHSNVRGKVLAHFVDRLDGIEIFLSEKGQNEPKLVDKCVVK